MITLLEKYKTSSEDFILESNRSLFSRRYLTSEELDSLRDHTQLYKRVVAELGTSDKTVVQMQDTFNIFLKGESQARYTELMLPTFQDLKSVDISQLTVSLFNPTTWLRPQWNYVNKPPEIVNSSKELAFFIKKIHTNSEQLYVWGDIQKGLLDNNNLIKPNVINYYLDGIKTSSLNDMSRLSEALHYISEFLSKLLSFDELALLLEHCRINEKFMFLLLYPYFFKPLKELLWSNLFPIFYLKANNFNSFMKKVALKIGTIISHQTAVVNGFVNIKVSKKLGLTLGTGGLSGILLLFSKHFMKDSAAVMCQMYSGLNGSVGDLSKLFRLEGSKLIFEMTKTLSTFSNAAIAGFLEPKQDAIKQLMRYYKK